MEKELKNPPQELKLHRMGRAQLAESLPCMNKTHAPHGGGTSVTQHLGGGARVILSSYPQLCVCLRVVRHT